MPPPSFHPIETKLAQVWPPQDWREVTVLLAVSGGADSVGLLRAMTALKTGGAGRLCAAHLNHQLRGDESDEDQAFVDELCRRLAVPCHHRRVGVDPAAAGGSDGLEAAARTARYQFLEQTAAELGARYVVTAHTADDQAETILHRIIRGTGIGGLGGMARVRPLGHATLIRPLLAVRRAELTAYLDDLRQPYRCDSSNADVRFTRNRIRHDLLPRLAEQFNPGVVDALLRLGSLAQGVQTVIDGLVEDLSRRCVVQEGSGAVQLDARVLAWQPRHVVRELLMAVWREQDWPMQAMGFAEWDRLAEMIAACGHDWAEAGAKQTLPGGVSAELEGRRLRLVEGGARGQESGASGQESGASGQESGGSG